MLNLDKIIKCAFALSLITAWPTLIQPYFDPTAARMVGENAALRWMNVGGYEYIYMQLLWYLHGR